jgi:methyl-accepting chemotaxis protein
LSALVWAGCSGPGVIRFANDRCYIDGHEAGLPQVEERAAVVQHRVAARQPWLVIITVVVVSLAGIGYVEKLMLLLSASREARGMGGRLRDLVERYRAHRLRYFALVGGSVGLLIAAGIFYIYLDADKRSSERALATLQFCHLALRTGEETSALDEQRRNLVLVHQTAGEIRQLIDKLPPAEQVKAQEIMGHMDDAVGRERRLITDHLARSEETTAVIRDGTASIQKDVTGLQAALGALKDLPSNIKGLAETMHRSEDRASAVNDKVTDLATSLQSMQRTLDGLASRPQVSCPACVCGDRTPVVAEKPGAAEAAAAASPPPAADPVHLESAAR